MKKKASGNVNIEWDPGEVNPKQKEFLDSHTLFTCYGGAKGGGKTHIVRIKAIGAALVGYPGIKILIMRKTYNELEENHIRPILRMVSPELFSYNNTSHLMTFENGSSQKRTAVCCYTAVRFAAFLRWFAQNAFFMIVISSYVW